MTVNRGALRQAVDLDSNWLNYYKLKQPSLGRVAVVAFYNDRYGEPSDVQCNSHTHHFLSKMMVNRLRYSSVPMLLRASLLYQNEYSKSIRFLLLTDICKWEPDQMAGLLLLITFAGDLLLSESTLRKSRKVRRKEELVQKA